MDTANLSDYFRRLTRGMAALTQTDQSDRQLVERAIASQDEAAFQTIVHRHGPMVYRVCWRVLQHQQDAEDAFQATFLVLAQKLRSLRKHASLASWLHGVAHRVALRAKAQTAAQRRREGKAALPDCLPADEVTWGELRSALDFQLNRLPDKWRLPLVLCYLEGRTQDEAAGQLGWSKSTLRRRLEEARDVLGSRLKACGITAPTVLAAVLLSDCLASAAPAFGLVASTVEAATHVAAGKAVVAVATAQVAALTEGVLKAMFLYKLKMVTALLLALLSVGILGGGVYTQAGAEQGPTHATPAVKAEGVARQPKPADRSATTQDAEKPVPTKDNLRGEEVKAAFLKAAGDDEPARALLAEVLKDAHRAKVLDEAVQHPERSGKLYAAEQWRLWQKVVSTPPGAKEADIPTAPEIALSFFLGSHPSSADALETEPPPDDPRITRTYRAAESDLLCKSLQLELFDPKRRGPFARLMAGWMATRADPWVVDLSLSHARTYRLPEVVPVARQVVRNAKLKAQHRAIAALALADLGGPAELPTLRGLMDDKTVWSSFVEGKNFDGPTFTVQLRDVAVGATLLLTDQDPGEFGFRQGAAELKLHEKLNGGLFAFTSDADRDAAHKKAKEWFDKQKKADESKKK